MIGQNINAYFNAAMMYPVERLEAVLRGQDKSIPAAAAMMVLPLKQREVAVATGMQAAQQQQQPQPTVRQQMTQAAAPQMPAQMQQQVQQLPENTGIMNVPVNTEFADGGIVAFDDGGYVQRYDGGGVTSSPIVRFFGDLFSGPTGAREKYDEQQTKLAKERELTSRLQQLEGYGFAQQDKNVQAEAENVRKELYALRSGLVTSQTPPTAKPATPPAAAPKVDEPKVDVVMDKKAPPPLDKQKGADAASGIGLPKMPAAGPSMSYEDILKKVGGTDEAALKKYADLGKEEKLGMEALLAEKEKNKPKGQAGDSLEKYLKKQEEAAAGKKNENLNMALINAGLAIAGGKSQYALQNIAEGAQVGTKQYQAGLDKLTAAADERAKLMAGIEDARRAEARGDYKDLYAAKESILKAQTAYTKAGIDAIVKLTGENRKVAADIFNNNATNVRALQQTALAGQYSLAGDKLKADAYGRLDKMNPSNIAADNAAKELQVWKDSTNGKLAQAKDPAAYENKRRELLIQNYKMQGLGDPFATAPDKKLFKVLPPE